MEQSEHLKNLDKIIPTLKDMVNNSNEPYIKYNVLNGTSFGFCLFSEPNVSVQRAFISKGATFPEHIHDNETEILSVYYGKCIYKEKEKEISLEPGCSVRIEKNVPHSIEALENTWIIGICIPSEEGYPHAGY